jgi:TPR repeat protein
VARGFPEAEVGRMRLELLLDGLRLQQEKLAPEVLARVAKPLEEAAGMGVASAMLLLAESHLASDPATAFRWYSAAAAKGVPSALTQVGLMYSNGAGVPADLQKAVEFFEQATAKGDPAAKAALGECLLLGRGVEKDAARAIDLLQQAVSKGNVRAMNRLGTCYHQGNGIEKNFTEAARLFEMAAAQRYAQAYGNLGVLYMRGEGLRQNARKAVELFQKGAREADPFCMFLYAQCLEGGMGITANLDEARSWYRRAAEAGMPYAAKWCRDNGVAFTEKGN